MFNARTLTLAGLCAVGVLAGCPRSKLPPAANPNVSLQSADYPAPPPWKVPGDPAARLPLAGLPSVADAHEGAYHVHAGLRIFFEGVPVAIPAGIGLDKYGNPVSPLHTHKATGVIHVEYTVPMAFRLGQFFRLWGVPLARATVYVDRQPVADPEHLEFQDNQQIVVLFGPPPSTPLSWPATPAPLEPSEDHASPTPGPSPGATASPAVEATNSPLPDTASASAEPATDSASP